MDRAAFRNRYVYKQQPFRLVDVDVGQADATIKSKPFDTFDACRDRYAGKPLQSSNANCPIDLTLSGITTLASFVQLANVAGPISTTPSGIVMLLALLMSTLNIFLSWIKHPFLLLYDSTLPLQTLQDGFFVPLRSLHRRLFYSYAGNTPGLCPVGCEAEKIPSIHDSTFRDIMILKLGIDSLPVGHGEVRPVELPSVDDRTQVPKEHDSDMREAGKLQGAAPDDQSLDPDTGRLGAR